MILDKGVNRSVQRDEGIGELALCHVNETMCMDHCVFINVKCKQTPQLQRRRKSLQIKGGSYEQHGSLRWNCK